MMSEEKKAGYIRGKIDTHVHSAPDVRSRKMTDLQLMEAAVERGVRGIVIKSHVAPTAGRAAVMNEVCREKYGDSTDFQMFGGITLNRPVGGINPWAVETALNMGGKIVWMPTIHSEHELSKKGESGAVICTRNGKVTEEVKTVLGLIRDRDAALATSHLSPYDIFLVVEEARTMGIKRIIISHPESNLVGLTVEEQLRLIRDYDVMLERCYRQPVGGGKYVSNLESNCAMVQEAGPENIIIATDAGQPQNPYWYESFEESLAYLAEHGISEEWIWQMAYKNPADMLGLEA
ncbi:MAG: DUF6282 family protein [Eubacteriales bacterium]|nr:DUF6282 family protein [Eubacteriales bacterium]